MHSYRAAPPGTYAPPPQPYADPDSDDDHVPLGAMVPPAGPYPAAPLPMTAPAEAYPANAYPANAYPANAYPAAYAPMPASAMAPGYDPQLEMELEQQQQQFQQQFLQQYHQMQMLPQQPCTDDAFAGQHALGFQSTPHNPNLPPQTYAMPAYLHAPPRAPAARAPNRRPWVRGPAPQKPAPAPHASNVAPPPPPQLSSSEDESSSSDESAYGINSDEEVPIAAANTAPAPISRHASTKHPLQPACAAANASSSEDDNDDDDDVPLSIISSSSTHNSSLVAAVRRTKTIAPSALSPRSQHAPPKSLSLRARSRGPARRVQPSGSDSDEDAPLDLVKAELSSGTRPVPASSSSRSASIAPSLATTGSAASEARPPSPQPSARESKTAGYLPKGTALPGLPLKRRSMKPRAAVQYVALADIIENAERAQARDRDGGETDAQPAADCAGGTAGEPGDTRSVKSFATASSSGGTLMETLRAGPVELLTASTEHSGSKATVDRVMPEDYGDLDQLLVDLDGIMSGSLAARRRFSLALMRRSLAVSNGLVEPADYSEEPEGVDADAGAAPDYLGLSGSPKQFIEFKPLEIANVGPGADGSITAGGLGLDDLINTTLTAGDAENAEDDDTQPLDRLAAKHTAAAPAGGDSHAHMPMALPSPPRLELSLDAPPEEPLPPAELTRTQKIQKALEKLDLLNVRKVSIRIYVQDARRYYTFALTEFTTSEMIINDMKKSGIIDDEKSNWALFELVDYFGIERPLNHFENLMTVVESWEPRSNNYIIAKGFSQQAALTLLGGVHPGEHSIQGMLYYRVKKNKWQKAVFRLHGHNMLFLKDSRGKAKKDAHYLTLTNNDVYTPFEPLRGAPTRYIFGLKSEMPMQMFEKPDEDYVKWFAVQTLDSLRQWLQVLRFSKNQIKFCQVLERRVIDSSKMESPEQNAPFKPLVDLTADKPDEDEDEPAKQNADIAAKIVSSLSRTATATKYDPAALLKIVEQSGIDVSDYSVLSANETDPDGGNADEQAEKLFLPGSLLSRPKKSAAEMEANQQQAEAEMFSKGSLLAQPRESKALAASRAMQNIMVHNGNVFAQGSLLQVIDEKKPRPPHVGGAALAPQPQFPLVQVDEEEAARIHAFRGMASDHSTGYPTYPTQIPPHAEEPVVFGGLLAASPAPNTQHPDAPNFPAGPGRQFAHH
ncbi:hypothetical protein H4R23_002827 [Coemansia sp. Cherry 401B]|nr:hypothetical protein H4R23_002827 [Coemansia sp. Cherry 401B]